MKRKPNIAVVGATGVVGSTYLKVLEERNFPFENIYFMASARSAGKTITFRGKDYTVEELTENSFDKPIDIAMFSAGGSTSAKFAPIAGSKGVTVVDNSSQWRMDEKVPLVVPEVNPEDIKWNKGIISNPNCSTIQAMVALKPLHDRYGIKRVVFSTYQAVSGSGVKGINDLKNGLAGNDEPLQAYTHPIAGNCLPHIDVFMENGYTKEEMKMYYETRKIMHSDVAVSATCVRVPTLRAHSESVWVETERPISVEEAHQAFSNQAGVILMDNPAEKQYPMPLFLSGEDAVYVGRVRKDLANPNGLTFWCVSDQIKKGAALNAVQIAEYLINENALK